MYLHEFRRSEVLESGQNRRTLRLLQPAGLPGWRYAIPGAAREGGLLPGPMDDDVLRGPLDLCAIRQLQDGTQLATLHHEDFETSDSVNDDWFIVHLGVH